ncbi:glutathionylspermidine synthase family protein [Solicola sp. PLA-1-18]|uniref:glutathionylspermidine synthase family protein n=1 Tax=Solicola sp. PLA-1-18 TaxID=3380532 RepID=UPI003B8281B7
MYREQVPPRRGWEDKVRALGLGWPTTDLPGGGTVPYWNEAARYEVTEAQVDVVWDATEALHEMCLAVVPDLCSGRYGDLGLPEGTLDLALASFEAEPPSVYGRFDLVYDGGTEVKMLEYNADTPTGLVESAVVQWRWLTDPDGGPGDFDQWNRLWEALVERWTALVPELPSRLVHMIVAQGDDTAEEWMTVEAMADTVRRAGLQPKTVYLHHVHLVRAGIQMADGTTLTRDVLVDADDLIIETAFCLYPWENMVAETYGGALARAARKRQKAGIDGDPMSAMVTWIEPLWKVVLSSKMLSVALWDRFGEDPEKGRYLLPAFREETAAQVHLTDWVRKPLHGREGDNIVIHAPTYGLDITQPGGYGAEGHIWQQYWPLPVFTDRDERRHHLVLGSWVVDGEPAGMLCRESDGPVTDYYSRVVPHIITDRLNPEERPT